MTFLMWYDDTPKRPLADKVADARAAYLARWGVAAPVVLVNPDDLAAAGAIPGVTPRATIRRNTVWVGQEVPS